MNRALGVFFIALAQHLTGAGADELSMPNRWPMDLSPTLDLKAVVSVGGPAMHGNGKIDLVDANTFKILKSAPLPDSQSASSVAIVPRDGSSRGAAVIAMKTQMIGVPDSVYMVSLEDSSFGNQIWKWTPTGDHGTLFTDHNAAIAKDASGKYIYVGTGSMKSRHGMKTNPDYYENRWFLHILDVSGPGVKDAGVQELPAYTAKSWYSGFGIFASAHHGHVIVASNFAGIDVGNSVVIVENAASDARQVSLHNMTQNGQNAAWYNILSWDATGAGFYADVSFWNADKSDLKDIHLHYDLQKGVVKTASRSSAASRVEPEYYGKGVLSGNRLYYTIYNPNMMLFQGLQAAIDAESLEDKFSGMHFGRTYWPMAATVLGDKLWVSWQCIDAATLDRYTISSASVIV